MIQVFHFLSPVEEQDLQEFQTSVVNCGNTSTSDSICTGSFTLEQVSNKSRILLYFRKDATKCPLHRRKSALLFVQGNSGDPLMCELDGSWFQAAVLSVENNGTRQTRADSVRVLPKLSRFQDFLSQTVGTFLSPNSDDNNSTSTTNQTTTDGVAPAHCSILLVLHLLVFSVCLHLFI